MTDKPSSPQIFYCPATHGFFHTQLHGANVPTGAIEVDEATYHDLLHGQSLGEKIILTNDNKLITEPPPPPTKAALSNAVRMRRDQRLTACDWTQMPDTALTKDQLTAWRCYRQALRDLPNQKGFPEKVNWPSFK